MHGPTLANTSEAPAYRACHGVLQVEQSLPPHSDVTSEHCNAVAISVQQLTQFIPTTPPRDVHRLSPIVFALSVRLLRRGVSLWRENSSAPLAKAYKLVLAVTGLIDAVICTSAKWSQHDRSTLYKSIADKFSHILLLMLMLPGDASRLSSDQEAAAEACLGLISSALTVWGECMSSSPPAAFSGVYLAQQVQQLLRHVPAASKRLSSEAAKALFALFSVVPSPDTWRTYYPGIFTAIHSALKQGQIKTASQRCAWMKCLLHVTALVTNDETNAPLYSASNELLNAPVTTSVLPHTVVSASWRIDTQQRIVSHLPELLRDVYSSASPAQRIELLQLLTALLSRSYQFFGVQMLPLLSIAATDLVQSVHAQDDVTRAAERCVEELRRRCGAVAWSEMESCLIENVSRAVQALGELSDDSFEDTIVVSVAEILTSLLLLSSEARCTAVMICSDELLRVLCGLCAVDVSPKRSNVLAAEEWRYKECSINVSFYSIVKVDSRLHDILQHLCLLLIECGALDGITSILQRGLTKLLNKSLVDVATHTRLSRMIGAVDLVCHAFNRQHHANFISLQQSCGFCGKHCDASMLFRCSRCKIVYYCSTDHQKSHWKSHRASCLAIPYPAGNKSLQILSTDELSSLIVQCKRSFDWYISMFEMQQHSSERTRVMIALLVSQQAKLLAFIFRGASSAQLQALHMQLVELLYALLILAVDGDAVISMAARSALSAWALYSGHISCRGFLLSNLDYITNDLCLVLRRSHASASSLLFHASVLPSSSQLVSAVNVANALFNDLRHIEKDNETSTVQLLRDIVLDSLDAVDDIAVMSAVRRTEVVALLQLMLGLAQRTLSVPADISDLLPRRFRSRESSPLQLSLFSSEILSSKSGPPLTTVATSQTPLDHDEISCCLTQNEFDDMKNFIASLRQQSDINGDTQAEEEEPEEDLNPAPSPSFQLLIDILKRCCFFLSVTDLSFQVTVVDTISVCMTRLATNVRVLLPAVHQTWPSLTRRLRDICDKLREDSGQSCQSRNTSLLALGDLNATQQKENEAASAVPREDSSTDRSLRLVLLLPHLLETIEVISVTSGDFVCNRLQEDVWPSLLKILRFLQSHSASSLDITSACTRSSPVQSSSGQHSWKEKLKISSLQCLKRLATLHFRDAFNASSSNGSRKDSRRLVDSRHRNPLTNEVAVCLWYCMAYIASSESIETNEVAIQTITALVRLNMPLGVAVLRSVKHWTSDPQRAHKAIHAYLLHPQVNDTITKTCGLRTLDLEVLLRRTHFGAVVNDPRVFSYCDRIAINIGITL